MRLETERLILRRWEPRDRAPFAALNADPEVMRHFPKPLDRTESNALIDRFDARWDEDGIGLAVAERTSDGAFVGAAGLMRIKFLSDPPLEGAMEVGWRLTKAAWGQGFATEAAARWLAHGFGAMALDEIIAITVPANTRSRAVMARLGMREDPARRFEHPLLPEGSLLRPHVLYALDRETWARGRSLGAR